MNEQNAKFDERKMLETCRKHWEENQSCKDCPLFDFCSFN